MCGTELRDGLTSREMAVIIESKTKFSLLQPLSEEIIIFIAYWHWANLNSYYDRHPCVLLCAGHGQLSQQTTPLDTSRATLAHSNVCLILTLLICMILVTLSCI